MIRASKVRHTCVAALAGLLAVFPAAMVAVLSIGGSAPVASAGAERSFVLRAGRVLPLAGDGPADGASVIVDGAVVVRDGRIEWVGPWSELDAPAGLPIVHEPDLVAMPGFVSASSGLGGTHAGEESVAAGYRAVDAYDPYADYRGDLAAGITTAHVNPGWHRLLSGQGCVVKLAGPAEDRVLRSSSDLTVNLGPQASDPPNIMDFLLKPSSNNVIEPARRQRPDSRLGQRLALKESIHAAADAGTSGDLHARELGRAWADGTALRVQAQHAADVNAAVSFLREHDREGYVVGGLGAASVASVLADSGTPLVYTLDTPLRGRLRDSGTGPDALVPDLRDLAALNHLKLALAIRPGQQAKDLRLMAAAAGRAGLSDAAILAALTRTPAEILGVADRVGSLEPGKDADVVLMTDHPLRTSASVARVFVGGRLVHDQDAGPVVIHAGTVWINEHERYEPGSVLIEDGKVAAVGRSVPRPPGARIVHAGDDAFVTPGLIDAYGHLGLDGDDAATAPELSLSKLVGTTGVEEDRVASSGVTTVLTASRAQDSNGSRVSAIKTAGLGREDRVVEDAAGLAFDLTGKDPSSVAQTLRPKIEAGRQYLEKWEAWRTKLAEWEEKRAQGLVVDTEPKIEEIASESDVGDDPITGTWEGKLFGGPLPEAVEGPVGLNLDGNEFEGRFLHPDAAEIEHRIVGTLDGDTISGQIEIELGGPIGNPEFTGTIEGEDFMTGTLSVAGGQLTLDWEARRTDRAAVEFAIKSRKRRTTGKDGIPLPPQVDDALEPVRAVLEKRAPVLVRADTAAVIDAALDVLVDEFELPVVLVDGREAEQHEDRLLDTHVGVVLPEPFVRTRNRQEENLGDRFARLGLTLGFGSRAEDGARDLPLKALFAVERGMSPDAALAALTTGPASMYKLEDRIGTIAPGAEGDLVIFTGHPMEAGSRVRRVIVSGRTVYREEESP